MNYDKHIETYRQLARDRNTTCNDNIIYCLTRAAKAGETIKQAGYIATKLLTRALKPISNKNKIRCSMNDNPYFNIDYQLRRARWNIHVKK